MKFPIKILVSSFVIASTLVPTMVKAAEPVAEPEATAMQAEEVIMQGSPIKVSATRVERDLMEVPMSVSVITAEDIKRNPATSIGELLQDIPGVTYNGTSGIIRVGIRGEDAFRTLILIDGQKVTEHKSMSGTPILVDPNNIERIEVIKGPASVLYGADAIGGVINIITKKDTDKVITGSVSLGYFGATDGFSENAWLAGSVNSWNYDLAVSNANHGNFQTPYGSISNSGFDQFDLRGSLSYDFTDKFTVGLDASYFDSDVPTSVNMIENESYVPFGYVVVPQWEMKKIGIFAEAKDLSESFVRLRVDTWYQETFKDFANAFNMSQPLPVASIFPPPFVINPNPAILNIEQRGTAKNTLDNIGASLQTDWAIGDNHYLIAGYEFSQETLSTDDYNFYQQNGVTVTPPRPGAPSIPFINPALIEYTQQFKGSQTSHAGYLAMESTLPADFIASYGVRYTSVKSDVTRSDVQILQGMPATAAALSSITDSKPVFNIGLVWTGVENLALRANWAQGFRVPTLDNKYITATKSTQTNIANPDLTPESSNNFELGARYMKGGFSADIAGFYVLADDYLDGVMLSDIDGRETWQTQNVASAKTYGAELALSYAFANGLKPYTSATFMRRKFEDEVRDTYDTFTPELVGRVGLAYNGSYFEDTVGFNADLYVRAQTGSDGWGEVNRQPAVVHYVGFGTLNLGIGADFGKDKEWTIQAEVLNILDRTYRYNSASSGTVEPGLNANLKLSYSF